MSDDEFQDAHEGDVGVKEISSIPVSNSGSTDSVTSSKKKNKKKNKTKKKNSNTKNDTNSTNNDNNDVDPDISRQETKDQDDRKTDFQTEGEDEDLNEEPRDKLDVSSVSEIGSSVYDEENRFESKDELPTSTREEEVNGSLEVPAELTIEVPDDPDDHDDVSSIAPSLMTPQELMKPEIGGTHAERGDTIEGGGEEQEEPSTNPTSNDNSFTSPQLPDRKPMLDTIKLDLAPSAEPIDSLSVSKNSGKGGHRVESANFLLESKFSELDREFQQKDSKAKESINTGTQSIQKTFNDIQNTVGGFGDMFGYKIDWEFWTRVVNDYQSVVMNEPNELNDAITRGIPKEFRGIIWQLIAKAKNFQLEEFYLHLKSEHSIHEKAIKRDLTRTSFFTNVEQVGKAEELFNVIKAYSLFDPDVGYTQGMMFVTIPLVMNMTDSECFCFLVNIMKEYNLRSLFCPEMKGLHLLLYQFDRLLEMYCPKLYNHLVKQGIKSSMYASQWFLTFFAYKFPLDMVLRIYDIIITQGMESILKFALNLMIKNESNLLALRFDKLLEFLKDKLFNYYVNEEYVNAPAEKTNLRSTRTASVSRRFSLLGKRNTIGQIASGGNNGNGANGYYKLDQLVSDAMEINFLPSDLKKFENEFNTIFLNEKAKEKEIEEIKVENGKLRHEIKSLEQEYTNLQRDHVDIVQEMVDIKVLLPEVVNDNSELREIIDNLRWDVKELESKIDEQKEAEKQAAMASTGGMKSPGIPSNIEEDINELLVINANETEKFANLEEELQTLIYEENELDKELEKNGGNKKWFGRW
ncbi:GTPase-activating protein Gyp5p [[Candida] anglica]|uniref:GTPase-activating protein Gyp5p n=1 Tax=[Candida] anglica TaxID=148631 RepID=A0ABP0E5D9_9ASCO